MPDSTEAARSYRQYAAKCLEIFQKIVDIDRRLFLLNMAQDWLKLADQVERSEEIGAISASSREFPAMNGPGRSSRGSANSGP
jgi:hypothetical protein